MAINEGLETINERAKSIEKDIAREKEMDEFHIERGKQKCQCWQCGLSEPQAEEKNEDKQQCSECGK
jgi:Zn finger protein HypA/HybF involved in hydrogenase expression